MKYYAFGIIGVIFVLVLILSTEAFNVLSDLSSVFFFMFALLNIIIIGAVIAIEMAKNFKLDMVQKELDTLEQEMYHITFSNNFSIEFTNESVELQSSLKTLQQKISTLQESSYEKL